MLVWLLVNFASKSKDFGIFLFAFPLAISAEPHKRKGEKNVWERKGKKGQGHEELKTSLVLETILGGVLKTNEVIS